MPDESAGRPPAVCPRCGAVDSYGKRYTTGGGWRVHAYVCEECGRTVRRSSEE